MLHDVLSLHDNNSLLSIIVHSFNALQINLNNYVTLYNRNLKYKVTMVVVHSW